MKVHIAGVHNCRARECSRTRHDRDAVHTLRSRAAGRLYVCTYAWRCFLPCCESTRVRGVESPHGCYETHGHDCGGDGSFKGSPREQMHGQRGRGGCRNAQLNVAAARALLEMCAGKYTPPRRLRNGLMSTAADFDRTLAGREKPQEGSARRVGMRPRHDSSLDARRIPPVHRRSNAGSNTQHGRGKAHPPQHCRYARLSRQTALLSRIENPPRWGDDAKYYKSCQVPAECAAFRLTLVRPAHVQCSNVANKLPPRG